MLQHKNSQFPVSHPVLLLIFLNKLIIVYNIINIFLFVGFVVFNSRLKS